MSLADKPVPDGQFLITGACDLDGTRVKVGDKVNDAIRVNVVAGSTSGGGSPDEEEATLTEADDFFDLDCEGFPSAILEISGNGTGMLIPVYTSASPGGSSANVRVLGPQGVALTYIDENGVYVIPYNYRYIRVNLAVITGGSVTAKLTPLRTPCNYVLPAIHYPGDGHVQGYGALRTRNYQYLESTTLEEFEVGTSVETLISAPKNTHAEYIRNVGTTRIKINWKTSASESVYLCVLHGGFSNYDGLGGWVFFDQLDTDVSITAISDAPGGKILMDTFIAQ